MEQLNKCNCKISNINDDFVEWTGLNWSKTCEVGYTDCTTCKKEINVSK